MTTINYNQFPTIKITHVPTNKTVEFDCYIERFSDNFASHWETSDVFGRMDDIKNFKRTTRTIELGWTVISEDVATASNNYNNCSTLMAMLYPVYRSTTVNTATGTPIELDLADEEDFIFSGVENIEQELGVSTQSTQDLKRRISDMLTSVSEKARKESTNQITTRSRQASVMSSPPIFKVNFANLIRNGASDENQLYGTIEGFKYEPDVEMGYFIDGLGQQQMMYPKVVSLSFAFTVIHTAPLGWEYDGSEYRLRNENFPFYRKK